MRTKIKIFTIFAFAFLAVTFLVIKGNTQSKTETAGQKFKSIKALNEMPADQMGKVMNMMSASLGVSCKFCHASNDGDYEKEGIEHKDIARQMLRMTFEMNKNYFENRPEISCSTCHQGRPVPQAAIPLTPVVREPRLVQPEKKPAVDEILAKYETALGGRANLAKITSREIKAQRLEPDGKTFEEEEIIQKGGKLLIKTIYPSKQYGDYTVEEVYDGRRARKLGNNSEIQLKPDELAQIEREAQLFATADLKAVYSKIEYRVDRIDGREVHLLIGTTTDNQSENLYFDMQTGLLIRRVASSPTVLGAFQYQVDYSDYRDFGGVRLPATTRYAVPNISWTRKILEVKNNAVVDDAKFSSK